MCLQKSLKSFISVILFTFFGFSAIANVVVLSGLTYEQTSRIGGSYRESIKIQNTGTEPQSVKVYQKDYTYNYTGESIHDEPGTLQRSNAKWINYSPTLLTLQPDESAVVDFEVSVPQIDSLKGTYWSVIMVEGLNPQDTTVSEGFKIHTAIRYAVQVITHIGNTGKRDLQFLGLELSNVPEEGNVLNVALENTGESLLRPELSIEVFDESGTSKGVFKTDGRKTYPGTSVLYRLVLEGIETGTYAAVLIADCGDDSVFGTNITLEI